MRLCGDWTLCGEWESGWIITAPNITPKPQPTICTFDSSATYARYKCVLIDWLTDWLYMTQISCYGSVTLICKIPRLNVAWDQRHPHRPTWTPWKTDAKVYTSIIKSSLRIHVFQLYKWIENKKNAIVRRNTKKIQIEKSRKYRKDTKTHSIHTNQSI